MYHAENGYLAATSEQMAIHVDMKTRKSASFSANILEKIRAVHESQRQTLRPKAAGRSIRLKNLKS
jgi:acyl-CoA thioester hydrolase